MPVLSSLVKPISKATGQINRYWDKAARALGRAVGIQDPLMILPYRGYGTSEQIYIKGRVLENEGIKLLPEDAPVWKNAHNMFRRFESDEIPNAEVQISIGDYTQQVTANREGFFELEMRPDAAIATEGLWKNIKLALLSPPPREQEAVSAIAKVIIVPDTARFGVISDIDDTVVYTAATDLFKMIRIAYLGNAHSRRPFAGVEAFYQALQQKEEQGNPIFYVSSSPWNMYDLFEKFMHLNDIPNGPILLRDIELSLANLLSFSHSSHKREQIEPILERFPDLPFLLIGDSGQKDAEIYAQLVEDYPGRIMGVYIRDVSAGNEKRRREVDAIAQKITSQGVEFVLFPDTAKAAEHAAQQGWIKESTLPDITYKPSRSRTDCGSVSS